MIDPNDEHPETLKMLQAQNAPTEDALKKKIARLTAQLKAEREPPISDLVKALRELASVIAAGDIDTHYEDLSDVVDTVNAASSRLRELEAGVMVSRERVVELLENSRYPLVGIYMSQGAPPLICAFLGNPCGVMDWLEKDFNDNSDCYAPSRGDGTYFYEANYLTAERGEYGVVEIPDGWELDFISFTPAKHRSEHEQ